MTASGTDDIGRGTKDRFVALAVRIRRPELWLAAFYGLHLEIAMKVYHPREFTAERAWGALGIERIGDVTVRLHWTDQPYVWHVNDGPEVFVVVDGAIDMHVRGAGGEATIRLGVGDIFHATDGDEHKAVPLGEARILVVERAGSI